MNHSYEKSCFSDFTTLPAVWAQRNKGVWLGYCCLAGMQDRAQGVVNICQVNSVCQNEIYTWLARRQHFEDFLLRWSIRFPFCPFRKAPAQYSSHLSLCYIVVSECHRLDRSSRKEGYLGHSSESWTS